MTAIPHKSVFRAQDVCEIADVQPYVLRSWEAEFPDLGVSKTPDGPRIYRRSDVELVLKLRDLLLVDGLTLAGARRRLIEEGAAAPSAEEAGESITDEDVAEYVDKRTKKSLTDVREGLGWILEVLDGSERVAKSQPGGRRAKVKSKSKPVTRAKGAPKRPAPKTRAKNKAARSAGRRKR